MNRSRFLKAAASLLVVAGCDRDSLPAAIEPPTKSMQSRVITTFTPFHELPDNVDGRTFAMLPSQAQESGLAWASYANQVAHELEEHGLRRVHATTGADYAVSFSYAMGWEPIEPATYTLGGQTFTTPGRPPRSQRPNADAPNTYPRRLEVTILDVARSRGSGRRVVIYEVEAVSQGSVSNIDTVLPYIIKGVFQSWPGQSGTPETVKVPMK